MAYTHITNRTSPNKWVGGNTIKGITIHWWDDPKKNPKAENIVTWLCNPASQVSAHFVITGTGRRVWQLVADRDRAWHAMNGNHSTLGLELDPRCRNSDYDVAAEVIADLWRAYGKLPLYPHSYWVATQCPGNWDLKRLKREAEAKLNPPKKPTPKPTPKPTKKAVSAAKKLPAKVRFKAKKSPTSVWDLETNPNYKAKTTLKKGAIFEAYAHIDFNGATYYVTEYSYGKKIKAGVNAHDLQIIPTIKPPVVPVTPPKPVEPPKPSKDDTQDARLSAIEAIIKTITDFLSKVFNNFKGGK